MALELVAYKRYAVVIKYTGKEPCVVIPEEYNGVPVMEIRENAFAHNHTVQAVILPSTVHTIGADAFFACHNLRYIGPETREFIPEDPDEGDISPLEFPSLSVFPACLQVVEAGAFAGTAIENVVSRSISLKLGESAFESCRKLHLVTLMSCQDLTLGPRVFMNSTLTRFSGHKARLDTLPDCAFANCTHLEKVSLHFVSVGARAFYRCEQLRQLPYVKALHNIGREAFLGCDRLEGVKLPAKRTAKPPKAEPKEPFSDPAPDVASWLPTPDPKPSLPKINTALLPEETPAEAPKTADNFDGKEPEDLGGALFMLKVNYGDVPPTTLPSKLKGALTRVGNTYRFHIHAPFSMSEVSLQALTGKGLDTVAPLIRFLVKDCTKAILLGKQTDDIYAVHHILPVSAGEDPASSLFSLMLERIRRPALADGAPENRMLPFFMRTDDELDAYMDVCQAHIPAWVGQAYQKNKRTANHAGTGRTAEDERKHAHRAMEILANVDWLPQSLHIPPAKKVRRLLDQTFYGMEPVKDRIEEITALIRRAGALPKWGVLLVGPAGTGKTSAAKGFARALDLPLIPMDMTSVGEEPEQIGGTSRIYTNARPGRLLEQMYQNRSSTAVLLANEVDKAVGKNGNHTAADILLSILDKTGFYENFLEETIPTDNLFCIGTCNDLSAISKPLLDRFHVIHVSPYSPEEKKAIFSRYVFPTAKRNANLRPEELTLDSEAMELLISRYALEPGARDLERYAERFIGDHVRRTDDTDHTAENRVLTANDVRQLLGPGQAIVRHFAILPGQVNAVFYHEGVACFYLLEATVTPGTGQFRVLGPLEKTQQEYCQVAYWAARSTLSSKVCNLSRYDVTVFVPQPLPESAANHVGAACYAAICSKLMNTSLAIDEACFIGGCDLNGNMYFDENDLTPLLRSMKARGITTVFAPTGTNALVSSQCKEDCCVMIVEAPDAKTLFSLAVAQSRRAG